MHAWICALVIALAAPARADTTVSLVDYGTGKPLVGRSITVVEPQACTRAGGCTPATPRRLTARTNKSGVARFTTGTGWQLEPVRVAGYLTGCPHHDVIETETRHALVVDSADTEPGARDRTISCRLVARSALRVRRAQDAIARASKLEEIVEWRATHDQLKPTARQTGISWEVSWGTATVMQRLVYVDGLDGYVQVGGRWTD